MCLCHFCVVSLRAGRIPGSLHCAAENGLALVCEVLFSDSRDFGLLYCTLSAAGETKHSVPSFLAWGLSGTSAKPFRKLLFSSLLYPFPASVYFNPPKLKQSVFLPSAPALTVALIFTVPAGTAGVSCWNIAHHPHPINLQAAIFRGEPEVGRGRACEEANIPLSNLYFTFL